MNRDNHRSNGPALMTRTEVLVAVPLVAAGVIGLCAYTFPRQAKLHDLQSLIDNSVSLTTKSGKIGIGLDSSDEVKLFLLKPNDTQLRPHTFLLEGGCEILTPQQAGILVDQETARALITQASNSGIFQEKHSTQVQALSVDFLAYARRRQ